MQIKQIATQQNIPDRYLEQLLAMLRRGNLVRSQRGAKGGYFLAREPWTITLLDVINCLEGSTATPSGSQTTATTEENAIVEEIWQEICDRTNQIFREYTLQDLWEKLNNRRQLNIMYYI